MTNIKTFKQLVTTHIQRDGVDNLLEWVTNETDFLTAPASTRYHGSYEGGLLEHSLNVFNQLVWEMNHVVGEGWTELYPMETVAIVALFHDLCKIDRYVLGQKWRKDENGEWESYDAYEYNQQKPEMGHGAQSVYYLQKFIQLTEMEAQAIYWHMGAYDISPYSTLAACSETFKWNPLAFLLHRADMAATYVVENEAFEYATEPVVAEAEPAEEVEEKPARKRARKTVKEEPVEEEQEEEKPARTRRRRKVAKEEDVQEEQETEQEEPVARITRRKKVAEAEPEEVKEEEPVEEEKPSKIRRPRKGVQAKSGDPVVTTYYFYNEADDYYYKKDVNEPDNGDDILVDELEYLDAMCPVLEEDFFYTLNGKPGKLAKGERLPEEYDEETWEPITEKEYEELTKPAETTVVRASRKKPTPSRRPRP